MAKQNVTQLVVTRNIELNALDLTSERQTQALAVLSVIEQRILEAVEDDRGLQLGETRMVAEAIGAARSLFEQAREAFGRVDLGATNA